MQINGKEIWFSGGMDSQGDACLYVQYLDAEGECLGYLSDDEIDLLADRFNDMGEVAQ